MHPISHDTSAKESEKAMHARAILRSCYSNYLPVEPEIEDTFTKSYVVCGGEYASEKRLVNIIHVLNERFREYLYQEEDTNPIVSILQGLDIEGKIEEDAEEKCLPSDLDIRLSPPVYKKTTARAKVKSVRKMKPIIHIDEEWV